MKLPMLSFFMIVYIVYTHVKVVDVVYTKDGDHWGHPRRDNRNILAFGIEYNNIDYIEAVYRGKSHNIIILVV